MNMNNDDMGLGGLLDALNEIQVEVEKASSQKTVLRGDPRPDPRKWVLSKSLRGRDVQINREIDEKRREAERKLEAKREEIAEKRAALAKKIEEMRTKGYSDEDIEYIHGMARATKTMNQIMGKLDKEFAKEKDILTMTGALAFYKSFGNDASLKEKQEKADKDYKEGLRRIKNNNNSNLRFDISLDALEKQSKALAEVTVKSNKIEEIVNEFGEVTGQRNRSRSRSRERERDYERERYTRGRNRHTRGRNRNYEGGARKKTRARRTTRKH